MVSGFPLACINVCFVIIELVEPLCLTLFPQRHVSLYMFIYAASITIFGSHAVFLDLFSVNLMLACDFIAASWPRAQERRWQNLPCDIDPGVGPSLGNVHCACCQHR